MLGAVFVLVYADYNVSKACASVFAVVMIYMGSKLVMDFRHNVKLIVFLTYLDRLLGKVMGQSG